MKERQIVINEQKKSKRSKSTGLIKSRNQSQKVLDYGNASIVKGAPKAPTHINASFSQQISKNKPLAVENQLQREKQQLKLIKLKNKQMIDEYIKKTLQEEKVTNLSIY